MGEHDEFRELLGAYVLGALDPAERAVLDEHVTNCERCRDELVAFAPLPGLLSQVSEQDLRLGVASSPRELVSRVRQDLASLRRSRVRWRRVAASAALVAVLALAAVLVGLGDDGPSVDRDTVALVIDSVPSVRGSIAADEREWGTYVHVSVEGLPARERYRIWAVDRGGGWHEAGSWLATDDGGAPTRLGASTHLHLGELARVVVTSADRHDVVLEAIPE